MSVDRGDRLSLGVTVFAILAGPANVLIVSWQVVDGGYTTWYMGAATVVLSFMSLRGRIMFAWIGFALLTAAIAWWGLATEAGHALALLVITRQLPVLIVGTLAAVGLGRTGDDIVRLTAETAARAGAEAAALAATAERIKRLAELENSIGPLLTRIAKGPALNEEERRESAVAEAGLRDTMRARALCLAPVVEAARDARRRGVEVLLLDDSDPSTIRPDDVAELGRVVSAALHRAKDGRVTARLLPPGRASIGTVVADGSEYARHDVGQVPD
jgi:hypothetical protein